MTWAGAAPEVGIQSLSSESLAKNRDQIKRDDGEVGLEAKIGCRAGGGWGLLVQMSAELLREERKRTAEV